MLLNHIILQRSLLRLDLVQFILHFKNVCGHLLSLMADGSLYLLRIVVVLLQVILQATRFLGETVCI